MVKPTPSGKTLKHIQEKYFFDIFPHTLPPSKSDRPRSTFILEPHHKEYTITSYDSLFLKHPLPQMSPRDGRGSSQNHSAAS
jgi:hypothetical protein